MGRQHPLSPSLGDLGVGGDQWAVPHMPGIPPSSTWQGKLPGSPVFAGGDPVLGSGFFVSRSDECNTQTGQFISDVRPFSSFPPPVTSKILDGRWYGSPKTPPGSQVREAFLWVS